MEEVGGKEVDGEPSQLFYSLFHRKFKREKKSKQAVEEGAVTIRSTDLDNVPPLLFELTAKIHGKI